MDDAASGSTLPFRSLRHVPPVDWTQLPGDLVVEICKRLHDLFDFVYFRAVCRKWRTATSIADLPPQIPWILKRIDSKHLQLYSLITGKTHSIHCPKATGEYHLKIPHGYLYISDSMYSDRPINFILNPLTNDEVHFESKRYFHGRMVCMDLDPMEKNTYIAFKSHNDHEMGFYQPHSRKWYYVQLPLVLFNWRSACFNNGLYYTVDILTRNTVVVDIARGISFLVPLPDNLNVSSLYLVESAGKILIIAMPEDLCTDPSNFNFSFDIYQLDAALDKNGGYRWVEISSIGNQILFLDFDGGISVAACETTGLKGNCIYYLEISSDELFRYNIEDGQVEKNCSFLDGLSNWFVPHNTGSLSVGSC